MTDTATTAALERLALLAEAWNEVQPVVAVRGAARREGFTVYENVEHAS